MGCGQHRHYHGGCCEEETDSEERRGRRWGAGYGPPPWAGSGYGWGFGPTWMPGPAERKETLEALKKHLEARLADVNAELGKL
ncbi:MAG: hypothetical protein M1132_09420 [Chloroflexi bacterium]|nr:hypothetical protein [Chloroflexota bacterium]